MSRYLITTADERSWKFDRPVLYLGEWCCCYDRKHVWANMDAIVAEPYGVETEQKIRNFAYIETLSSQLLIELVDVLNTFHNTEHGLRYWCIVLGHWVKRYVETIFNRYHTLELVLQDNEHLRTTVFDSTNYLLATSDSLSFIYACNDDEWNHVLYSKILDYLGSVQVDLDPEPLRGIRGFDQKINLSTAKGTGFKRYIRKVADEILPKFKKHDDAFIINSYLPLKEEIKLQLSMGQCPQFWRSPVFRNVKPDPVLRKTFNLDLANHVGFDYFIRKHLHELIPTCFLEGYTQLTQQADTVPWPTKPKFIFTSNNFDLDEIFKVWTASKVEQGIPYYTGQHGNNFGTHIYYGNKYWPERSVSDKFITWGWASDNRNEIPAFIFKTASSKFKQTKSDGGLLLIELHPPNRLGPEDCYFEYGIYQEEQFRFVESLPVEIQEKLTVRQHAVSRYHNWSEGNRWKDRSPHTHLEAGVIPLRKLIDQSRLVVHSYDSTGILETLALNIPTIAFWYGGLEHLLPRAKPYYDLLIDVGIIAKNPEHAAKFIVLHWDNIIEWWESEKVQDARMAFCAQFARAEKKPIRTLKQLLTLN